MPEHKTDAHIREHPDKIRQETGGQRMTANTRSVVLIVYGVLVIFGIGTGYMLASKGAGGTAPAAQQYIKEESVVGIADEKTFSDSAEGILQRDGAQGEGTHHLLREGGPSQTVYLISSVVDLDQFIDKKVKIWGQTMAAKKVSWLMDVGKVELLNQ